MKFSGLIYLAAPIESGMSQGLEFKSEIIRKLAEPPVPGLVLYDPFRPFEYDDIESAAPVIKRINRLVIQHSNIVIALLAGCETWREIEFAHTLPVAVWGMWPEDAKRSATAEQGVLVFESIDEIVNEIRAMVDDAR